MQRRRKKVEAAMLRGTTRQCELAVRFGVSEYTISRDCEAIRERWKTESAGGSLRRRITREAQLNEVFREAMLAWDRSKETTDEVTTTYRKEKCPVCKGKGCDACVNGRVTVEMVSQKTSGKPGDPAYLNAALRTLVEICKLRGLYPVKPVNVDARRQTLVFNAKEGRDPLEGVPTQLVLEAREVAYRIAEAKKKGAVGGNGDAKDAPNTNHEDDG